MHDAAADAHRTRPVLAELVARVRTEHHVEVVLGREAAHVLATVDAERLLGALGAAVLGPDLATLLTQGIAVDRDHLLVLGGAALELVVRRHLVPVGHRGAVELDHVDRTPLGVMPDVEPAVLDTRAGDVRPEHDVARDRHALAAAALADLGEVPAARVRRLVLDHARRAHRLRGAAGDVGALPGGERNVGGVGGRGRSGRGGGRGRAREARPAIRQRRGVVERAVVLRPDDPRRFGRVAVGRVGHPALRGGVAAAENDADRRQQGDDHDLGLLHGILPQGHARRALLLVQKPVSPRVMQRGSKPRTRSSATHLV